KYRDVAQLTRFVASATAVVLPYESRDQVTSGVLVDALAAGRPVIATAFPHAVELLGSGAGIVVPHGDPLAMADAIRLTLTDDDAIDSMATEARRLAPSFSWSAVAAQYLGLADDLVQTAASIAI
ncbi:MAG: glycosyltransferase, partial [Ilumatobacteraceae bacterium]